MIKKASDIINKNASNFNAVGTINELLIYLDQRGTCNFDDVDYASLHYHLAKLYFISSDEASALIHINKALQLNTSIDSIRLKSLILSSLGATAEYKKHAIKYSDEFFSIGILPDGILSLPNLLDGIEIANILLSNSSIDHKQPVVNFILKCNSIINELGDITRINFSLSYDFPSILEFINKDELEIIIKISLNYSVFFQRTAHKGPEWLSLNRCKTHGKELSRVGLPHWLRILSANNFGVLVFDSCGERHYVSESKLNHYFRNFRNSMIHKFCYVSANPTKLLVKHISKVYFNYWCYKVTDNYYSKMLISKNEFNIYASEHKSSVYLFSIFNGTSRPHRCAIMILFFRYNLLSKGLISWWENNEKILYRSLKTWLIDNEEFRSLSFTENEIRWLSTYPSYKVESSQKSSISCAFDIPFNSLYKSKIHVVSETDFIESFSGITEKTIKFIGLGIPLLVLGTQGIIAYLIFNGFDLLQDKIEHSYDNEADPAIRLMMLVDELIRLENIEFTTERLLKMRNNNIKAVNKWREEHYKQTWFALIKGISD